MEDELVNRRVRELMRRVRSGLATDADREELKLHGVDVPDIAGLAHVGPQSALDDDWMGRAEADRRLVAAESTPYTRAERRVGVALVAGGMLSTFVFPLVGIGALFIGSAVLFASVLRVKLKTFGQDPYKDIER